MRCKKLTIFSGMLLSGFFACLSFSSCHAISDYVVTFDHDNLPSSTTNLCIRDSQHSCSDYHYLIIETNFVQSDLNTTSQPFLIAINTTFQNNDNNYISTQYNVPLGFSNFTVLSLSLNNYSISSWFVSSQNSLPSGWFIKYTFTENYSSSVQPSGSINISENGTYNVSDYATAVVDVPTSSSPEGQYHNDLEEIKKAILIGSATLLVLYFFYCIYRIIISYGGSR